jgi:molecular chaperone DnaK
VIGGKALDYLQKDAENISFKREMGIQDTYFMPSIDKEMSPIDLSSLILKVLKNVVNDDEVLDSVVITIPASFDTIQSNATKKVGYLAGFKEVVLLQEPSAACLAFANTSNIEVTDKPNWIVYGFGGGTVNVAWVEVNDRELKVKDNQGDNYLGGADFDSLIVECLIVPFIEAKLSLTNLWRDLKTSTTNFKGLYFELLNISEEAKKELSYSEETEIEIDIDINGDNFYELFVIKREQFEDLIAFRVEQTITFIQEVIKNNQLLNSQIHRVILIGVWTYVPMIKRRITEAIGVEVNSGIDATFAVVHGAAYFAGSKPATVIEDTETKEKNTSGETINFKLFYEQNTRDLVELIICKVNSGATKSYRIMRKDRGLWFWSQNSRGWHVFWVCTPIGRSIKPLQNSVSKRCFGCVESYWFGSHKSRTL